MFSAASESLPLDYYLQTSFSYYIFNNRESNGRLARQQRRIIRASCEAPQQDIQYTQDTILPAQDDNIYVADSERANRRTCIPLEDMYLNNMARLKPPRSCDLPNVQHLCKNCY
ncbi:uncharacterized protein LOC108822688 [Raphanus sativus]|uniref:Uncharacterized protein LOC108822688 n=1 Tax=Raphanus sativus TaxID=3726 RepID=A0A9W3CLG7_RAPSA|nr:uncharacterized protein LOC108822688 [Raphanus sativus]